MKKIQFFSEKTNKFYQLLPTKTIPTLRISGVPMHRFAKIDPLEDTLRKIKSANPHGIVLDSCCGLGYTAIYSARKEDVKLVYSFEIDENVLRIARLNEYSKELFENKKIILKKGDVSKEVKNFSSEFFDVIIHDPPTFKMAPELYSEDFYKKLKKVLKVCGRLWHYCPNPGKMKANNFKDNLKKKLRKYFKFVSYDENSMGFVCQK
ncbi:MAG: methyltransferase [Candidatus Pacearchaeota archaeon]